ncbi:SGNH/GDSL hydrolase family protein [Variovorax sp. J22R133]|uniref:SGNH/GDSL hydrolase family protein n=1 Tax=Variovorax brevis TaxID=3053503 RepID=UPI00257794E6|nr:SGNH/GDSL hydrolase family protein [Variovorax sp. J22R133]MDM0114230.1 SGNH/GDSL hydrolase family protein [Variovorax sp. J22R133]
MGTPSKIPFAVMGDSNSMSFQDHLSIQGPEQRGGAFRDRTFQWGEVIARLRGNELDPGPWETWGVSNPALRWLDVVGIPVGRAPRKEDYRYNFANEGARCEELMHTRRRQTPRLVALMDKEPGLWRDGVVIIRIGLSNVSDFIDVQAVKPGEPAMHKGIEECMQAYREAVSLIRKTHPTTHIVLVGTFNDTHDAINLKRWHSASEIANISKMCDEFDDGLRKIVAATPRTSFFDDRAWFRAQWGSRDADGLPAYKTIVIGSLRVTHSVGDAPTNSMLGDDHNGLVWNVLWAQAMVQHLRDVVKLPVTPIGADEVQRFVRSLTSS